MREFQENITGTNEIEKEIQKLSQKITEGEINYYIRKSLPILNVIEADQTTWESENLKKRVLVENEEKLGTHLR